MEFNLNKVVQAVGPSAALGLAGWLFLHLLEQRHVSARKRYRDLVGACRRSAMSMRHAADIGMTAALLLLLSLMISALDAVSRADWMKLFGAPSLMLGLLLVFPGAILVIIGNTLVNKLREPGLAGVGV